MKYFRKGFNWQYAILEICIVCIGILIAFSINTCAANLKSEQVQQEYKSSLKQDIEENLKNINSIILAQNAKVVQLKSLIQDLENQSYNADSVAGVLFRERKSPTFFPISGTFKSLVAHGDIELFDTQMKRSLFNLYDTFYERTVYNGNLYDKVYLETYDTEIRNILNLRTRKIEDANRLNSHAFIKNLSFVVDEAESYLNLIQKSKIESENILEKLN